MKKPSVLKHKYGWIGAAAAMCGMAVLSLSGVRDPMGRPERQVDRSLVPLKGGAFLRGSREPGGMKPEEVTVTGFLLGKHEVTVGEYVRYLNEAGAGNGEVLPHAVWRRGRFEAAFGKAQYPVTGVRREDAEAYCRWLSEATGLRVRLPTEVEWEYAARAGIHGARYPWGWGDPTGRARFAAKGMGRVGRFAPNAFGLYDMAGNVFEWCAGETEDGMVPARGGSWAERDPDLLCVFRRVLFPVEYRDLDVGFRIAADARNEKR